MRRLQTSALNRTGTIAALAVALLAAACGSEPTARPAVPASPPKALAALAPAASIDTARIRVFMTDAPIDDVDHIWLDLQRVELGMVPRGGEEWVSVPMSPMRVDLLALRGGVLRELGSTTLPPGELHMARLVISSAEVEIDGVLAPVQVPSGAQTGLKIPLSATIAAGDDLDLTIDFDAAASFVWRPGKGWLLKPVLSGAVEPRRNSLPVAQPMTVTTTTNVAVSGVLSAVDPDGDVLRFALAAPSDAGLVWIDEGSGAFTFVPAEGYAGTTTFDFVAADAEGASTPATVTIDVAPPPLTDPAIVWVAQPSPPLVDEFDRATAAPLWHPIDPGGEALVAVTGGRLMLDTGETAVADGTRVVGVVSARRFFPQSFAITAEVTLHAETHGGFAAGLILAEDGVDTERTVLEMIGGLAKPEGGFQFLVVVIGPDGAPEMQTVIAVPGTPPVERPLRLEMTYDEPAQKLRFALPEVGFAEVFPAADLGGFPRRLMLAAMSGIFANEGIGGPSRMRLSVDRLETTLRDAGHYAAAYAPVWHDGAWYARGIVSPQAIPLVGTFGEPIEILPGPARTPVPLDGTLNVHRVLGRTPQGTLHTVYTTLDRPTFESLLAGTIDIVDFREHAFVADEHGADYLVAGDSAPDTSLYDLPPFVSAETMPAFIFAADVVVAGFECCLNAHPWQDCASPWSPGPLRPGLWRLDVRAVDFDGNVDPVPASHFWRVDLAPETLLASTPATITSAQAVQFDLASDDREATFECRLNTDPFALCDRSPTWWDLGEGEWVFEARAVDIYGLRDPTPAAFAFTVDRTPPTSDLLAHPPVEDDRSSATFAFASADGGVQFTCEVTFGWEVVAQDPDCASPWTVRGLEANTEYVFRLHALDAAGNVQPEPTVWTWLVTHPDNPETSFATTPGAISTSRTADFAFASDRPATFECRLDGGAWVACGSPYTLRRLSFGEHTLAVRAIATGTGNVDLTPAVHVWQILDGEAPETILESVPPSISNVTMPTFTFVSDDLEARFECRVDGAAWAMCLSGQAVGPLAGGAHVFEVRAIDLAGNIDETPSRYAWTTDEALPSLYWLAQPPAKTHGTSLMLAFATDRPATLTCALDGDGPTPCESPLTLSGLAIGEHRIAIQAEGLAQAGDPAELEHRFEVVDPDAPDTLLVTGPTGAVHPSEVYIEFEGVNANRFECNLNPLKPKWRYCETPIHLGDLPAEYWLPDGIWTLQIRAVAADATPDPTPLVVAWITRQTDEEPETYIVAAPADGDAPADTLFSFESNVPAGFECSLNGGVFQPCNQTWSVAVEPGPSQVAVRAISLGLVRDSTPAVYVWEVGDAGAADPLLVTLVNHFGSAATAVEFVRDAQGKLAALSGVRLPIDPSGWAEAPQPDEPECGSAQPAQLPGSALEPGSFIGEAGFTGGLAHATRFTSSFSLSPVFAAELYVTGAVDGVGPVTASVVLGRAGVDSGSVVALTDLSVAGEYCGPTCTEQALKVGITAALPGALENGVWDWTVKVYSSATRLATAKGQVGIVTGSPGMSAIPELVNGAIAGEPPYQLTFAVCERADVKSGVVHVDASLNGRTLSVVQTEAAASRSVAVPVDALQSDNVLTLTLTSGAGVSRTVSKSFSGLVGANEQAQLLRAQAALSILGPWMGLSKAQDELELVGLTSGTPSTNAMAESVTSIVFKQKFDGRAFRSSRVSLSFDDAGRLTNLAAILAEPSLTRSPIAGFDSGTLLRPILEISEAIGRRLVPAGEVERWAWSEVEEAYLPYLVITLMDESGVPFLLSADLSGSRPVLVQRLGGLGSDPIEISGQYNLIDSDGGAVPPQCSPAAFGSVQIPSDQSGFYRFSCRSDEDQLCLEVATFSPWWRMDEVEDRGGGPYNFPCHDYSEAEPYWSLSAMTWNKFANAMAWSLAGYRQARTAQFHLTEPCAGGAACALDFSWIPNSRYMPAGWYVFFGIRNQNYHGFGWVKTHTALDPRTVVHETAHLLQYSSGWSTADFASFEVDWAIEPWKILTSLWEPLTVASFIDGVQIYKGPVPSFLEGTAEAVGCTLASGRCGEGDLRDVFSASGDPHTQGQPLADILGLLAEDRWSTGYFGSSQPSYVADIPALISARRQYRSGQAALRLLRNGAVSERAATVGGAFTAVRDQILAPMGVGGRVDTTKYALVREVAFEFQRRGLPIGVAAVGDSRNSGTPLIGLAMAGGPGNSRTWINWNSEDFDGNPAWGFYWNGPGEITREVFDLDTLGMREVTSYVLSFEAESVGSYHDGQMRHGLQFRDKLTGEICGQRILTEGSRYRVKDDGRVLDGKGLELAGRRVLAAGQWDDEGTRNPARAALFECGYKNSVPIQTLVPIGTLHDTANKGRIVARDLDLAGVVVARAPALRVWNDVPQVVETIANQLFTAGLRALADLVRGSVSFAYNWHTNLNFFEWLWEIYASRYWFLGCATGPGGSVEIAAGLVLARVLSRRRRGRP